MIIKENSQVINREKIYFYDNICGLSHTNQMEDSDRKYIEAEREMESREDERREDREEGR